MVLQETFCRINQCLCDDSTKRSEARYTGGALPNVNLPVGPREFCMKSLNFFL